MSVASQLPFTGAKRLSSNILLYDNSPVCNVRDAQNAQNPDLDQTKHLWDDLERRPHDRPPNPTSVPDLDNAVVPE